MLLLLLAWENDGQWEWISASSLVSQHIQTNRTLIMMHSCFYHSVLYDAILFASVRPQFSPTIFGGEKDGRLHHSPNNCAKMGDSPITPTFHPWLSPFSWAGIKGCVSTMIGSSISAAVLDSQNPLLYVL